MKTIVAVLMLLAAVNANGYAKPPYRQYPPKDYYYAELPKKDYEFNYGVVDKYTGQDFTHKEKQNGATITGSYSVALPDGRTQIVTYSADDDGYKADVAYSDAPVAAYAAPPKAYPAPYKSTYEAAVYPKPSYYPPVPAYPPAAAPVYPKPSYKPVPVYLSRPYPSYPPPPPPESYSPKPYPSLPAYPKPYHYRPAAPPVPVALYYKPAEKPVQVPVVVVEQVAPEVVTEAAVAAVVDETADSTTEEALKATVENTLFRETLPANMGASATVSPIAAEETAGPVKHVPAVTESATEAAIATTTAAAVEDVVVVSTEAPAVPVTEAVVAAVVAAAEPIAEPMTVEHEDAAPSTTIKPKYNGAKKASKRAPSAIERSGYAYGVRHYH